MKEHRLGPIVITGPTASGKGAVALELALRTGGEIVSLDSMKIFRELDVATAKPSAERRAAVPHHLIDLRNPHEDFSTGELLPLLSRVLGEIAARGRTAILTGGTALYVKGYLDGFQAGPPADWGLRSQLLAEASARGPQELHERLRRLDPVAAQKIHPRDVRRTVRALEVIEKTGRPISEDWAWAEKRPLPDGVRLFGLEWSREALYSRINARVERMAAQGLFEEAQRLERRDPPLSRTALQTIGYREIWEGTAQRRSRSEVLARIQQATRRFAKSQLTWFRKLPLEWLSPVSFPDAASLAGEILRRVGAPA